MAQSRSARLPTRLTINRQIEPNPRDLEPSVWAKLVHAALELTEEDLPRSGKGPAQYPLAMVRAIAATLVYSGLRSDEIMRLPVSCIRWQREDVRVPESGAMLPKDAVCFLTVPVNKTSGTFQKPVNPVVGHRINEWEQIRAVIAPNQSPFTGIERPASWWTTFSHIEGECWARNTSIRG
jgi:integrase